MARYEEKQEYCHLQFSFLLVWLWVYIYFDRDYQDNQIIEQQTRPEYSTLNFIEGWCFSVLSSYS